MSKKYKDAMDKIKVSEELKSSIIENAGIKSKSGHSGKKHININRIIGCAACFAALTVSVAAMKSDIFESRIPDQYENAVYEQTTENTEVSTEVLKETTTEEELIYPKHKSEAAKKSTKKIYNDISCNTNSSTNQPSDTETTTSDGQYDTKDTEEDETVLQNDDVLGNDIDNSNIDNDSELEFDSPVEDYFVLGGFMTEEYSSLDELSEFLNYAVKTPQYLPKGYDRDSIYLMFDTLVEINYVSDDDVICFRTEASNFDVSGDYTEYNVTEKINDNFTIKGDGDKYYLAELNGENSYSVHSQKGLDKDELIKIVESIK